MQQPVQNTEQRQEEQRQEVDVQKREFPKYKRDLTSFSNPKSRRKKNIFLKNRKIKTATQEITDKMRLKLK